MPAILIIDDNALDREAAGRCLSAIESLSIRYAQDGVKGLEAVRRETPDAVLTDLRMPGLGGLELVERLRQEFPLVPVVLMTSQGSEKVAVQALRAGAASYVPKQALKLDLADTVRQVLDLAEARRSEGALFGCLRQCETRFELTSDLELISPLVGYFQDNLKRLGFGDDSLRTQICIALMEVVSNAMIHGNLEVESDLRKEGTAGYFELIRRRRRQPPYSDRRVVFTARESPRAVEYVIQDDGPGFDCSCLPDPTRPENLLRVSGRGVMLIRTFMDSVEFNDKGNRVTMIKKAEA